MGVDQRVGIRRDSDVIDELALLEQRIGQLRASLEARKQEAMGGSYASHAEAVIEGRIRLARYLPGDYFRDPAFDMALDLFVAAERGERRTFKECAIASRVSQATASRYVELMVHDGIVDRTPDDVDRRRIFVTLTPAASTAMRAWMASLAPTPSPRA